MPDVEESPWAGNFRLVESLQTGEDGIEWPAWPLEVIVVDSLAASQALVVVARSQGGAVRRTRCAAGSVIFSTAR